MIQSIIGLQEILSKFHYKYCRYNVQYKLIKVTIIRYLMLKSNDKNSILYVGINDKLLSIHLNNCLFVSAISKQQYIVIHITERRYTYIMASTNANLHKAKNAKNDEFYTQLTDVAKELMHYKHHFKDKIVLCNCDDPTWSAFWKYFHLNFTELGLKKLISTHYDKTEPTYKMEYTGGDDNDIEVGVKTPLEGNGDFRNQECLDLLDECDIVVTNEPFSLFREYVAILMEHKKKFLIIGNKNAITYKEFFPLLKDNEVWLGCTNVKEFLQPDGSIKKFGNIGWFTNLDVAKRHEKLILWKKYTPEEYPKYDNYLAWNVNKVSEIPCDDYIDIEIDESELEVYKSIYPDLEVLSDD